jgi:RNase H-fold protein (predicted Holliday junction resolvase)
MISIGIGEIQKNISIFKNINEEIKIVDKRKKETLAIVYPIKQEYHKSIVNKLAGKYKDKIQQTNLSLKEIKELAMEEAMKEKYGLSS